jgi:hypothetical protein
MKWDSLLLRSQPAPSPPEVAVIVAEIIAEPPAPAHTAHVRALLREGALEELFAGEEWEIKYGSRTECPSGKPQ